MYLVRLIMTAALLVAIGVAGTLSERLAGRARGADAPTADLGQAEFAQLLKQLHVKNQPWAGIGWKVSLTEARQLAAKENKPVFLVVNTGNCLGWT